MKRYFLLFLLFGSVLFAAERTRVMMGTFVTVSVSERDAGCIDRVFEIMHNVEMVLSSYDPEAEVYRLNHERNLSISPVLYDAFLKSERYYVQSGGYFDVTVGALTKGLFRFGEQERIPDAGEMAEAAVGFSRIEYNETYASLPEGVLVDFGGFGKGYGADMGMAALKRCGAESGTIALSGDIRCLGSCLLAIQDPFDRGTFMTLQTVSRETGMTTSGNYRRYVGDKSHSHLIDPSTRRSEQAFASVTLIGTVGSSDLDAWATAAAVMPPENAVAFLDGLDAAYVLVYEDGTIVKSGNLADYATLTKETHEND